MELIRDLAQAIEAIGEGREEARELAASIGQLAAEIASWSNRMNLTGPRTAEAIAKELLAPPLAWSRLLPHTPASITDIGSGAGIPGFSLALRFPSAETTLVEARERRHHFQRHAIRSLGLKARALWGRAEELEPRLSDLGTAQALAPLPEAVFHVKRWTRVGGLIAIPQSEYSAELDDSDLEWKGCPEYREPFSDRVRFLWLSERIR